MSSHPVQPCVSAWHVGSAHVSGGLSSWKSNPLSHEICLSRPTVQVSHSSVALSVAVTVTSVRPAQLHVIVAVSVFFPWALHLPSVVVNVSVSVVLVVMVKLFLVNGGVSSVRLQPVTSTVPWFLMMAVNCTGLHPRTPTATSGQSWPAGTVHATPLPAHVSL